MKRHKYIARDDSLPLPLVQVGQLSVTDESMYTQSTGPKVIELFPCSTQLSTKFILLINVKMPTVVGILTFISMINTSYKSFKARLNTYLFQRFSFYEQLKFYAQLS